MRTKEEILAVIEKLREGIRAYSEGCTCVLCTLKRRAQVGDLEITLQTLLWATGDDNTPLAKAEKSYQDGMRQDKALADLFERSGIKEPEL